jgi:hypothetical protein
VNYVKTDMPLLNYFAELRYSQAFVFVVQFATDLGLVKTKQSYDLLATRIR